jgi:hypothetical protein
MAKRPIPEPHPLEAWLVERARVWQDEVGPRRFDEVNVSSWLSGGHSVGRVRVPAASYKRVALDLLQCCQDRGVIERNEIGWCRLAAAAEPVVTRG